MITNAGKNKVIQNLIVIILFAFLVMVFVLSNYKKDTQLHIKNGMWDATSWNQNHQDAINLSGDWEFYWRKLLYKKDFIKNRIPDLVVSLPSVWNKYKIAGKHLPGRGYATFRMHVKNAQAGKKVALRISPLLTSYRMYIDQKLTAENGYVSTNEKSSKPEYKVKVIEYTPQNSAYDIILQVSNYTCARGGVLFIPQIGSPDKIKRLDNLIWFRDSFLFGCFLFMLLFSLALFLLQPEQKSNLYFSFLCFCIIIRTIIFGGYLVSSIPVLSDATVIIKLDYLSLSLFVPAFIMLTDSLFTEVLPKKLIQLSNLMAALFTICIMFLQVFVFTKLLYLLEISNIIFTVIVLFYLCHNRKKKKDCLLLVIAIAFFFFCGIHDLMIQNNYISGSPVEYMPVGFLLSLICEEILIVRKYSTAVKENENALYKIEKMKQREREIELKFLKSQIKPNFIHNALHTVISVFGTNPDEARKLLVAFSHYLRGCFEFENLETMVPLEKELEFVRAYLTLENARLGDKLHIDYDIEENRLMIPPLILQPLVENAIIHKELQSNDQENIRIFVNKQQDMLKIGVCDDRFVIEKNDKEHSLIGCENNYGTGLYNISQRLKKIYGTGLTIENATSGRINIYMSLPLTRESD